jgi:hypothetical protein
MRTAVASLSGPALALVAVVVLLLLSLAATAPPASPVRDAPCAEAAGAAPCADCNLAGPGLCCPCCLACILPPAPAFARAGGMAMPASAMVWPAHGLGPARPVPPPRRMG